MKWGKILKVIDPSLSGLPYNDHRVKQHLRVEGEHRCIYCSINESVLGGYQFFWVEHLRPQSLFDSLKNDLNNLFYSCPMCNRFKSDDWPNDDNENYLNPCYPDPSKVDYADLFEVRANGHIKGTVPASVYMTTKLFLNRHQLILERTRFFLNERCEALIAKNSELNRELRHAPDKGRAMEHMSKMSDLKDQLLNLKQELETIPPYEQSDVTRP